MKMSLWGSAEAVTVAGVSEIFHAASDDGDPTQKEDQYFWWYTLLATGALLFAELWVGNSTLRH